MYFLVDMWIWFASYHSLFVTLFTLFTSRVARVLIAHFLVSFHGSRAPLVSRYGKHSLLVSIQSTENSRVM